MKNNLYNFNYVTNKSEVAYDEKEPTPVEARFVRTDRTGDKVYLLADGKKFWITSAEVLQALGGGFDEVKTIEFTVLQSYPSGEPLNMDNLPTNIPAKIEEKKEEVAESIQLKAHDEATPDSAPQEEPVKGLTSIIIPAYLLNYPIFHMTGNCIGSIKEHIDKEKTPYEIILVLNGNKDGIKFASLKDTLVDKIIVNEENKGFPYAVNQGIRCAKGEYIAIVSTDVLVYDNWLEDMQLALESLDLVMATPMYGMPYARAIEAKELRNKTLEPVILSIIDTYSNFRDFSCVLTRKTLFDEIGMMNEEFLAYSEDVDFLRRMDKFGKKYASTKRVNTTHIIGGTSTYMPETPEMMNESKAKLKEIWGE